MQRRKFLTNSGIVAVGVGVFGSISWSHDRFIGDTPTTSDVLGPFYRPNAPIRTNINPAEYNGPLFHLSGTVFREDSKTPFINCLVEVWQCDSDEVYDNTSDEYRYRGAQKTNAKGQYHFITTHPVAYKISEQSNDYRPAHIHMRLSGDGQQDLITQVYFTGDPYIAKDVNATAPGALNRILPIQQNGNGDEKVRFDIVMAKEYIPSDSAFDKVCGVYQMSNNALWEFYRSGDLLFLKVNGQIVHALSYSGGNEFINKATSSVIRFEPQTNGEVRVCYSRTGTKECTFTGIKAFKY